MNRLDQQPLSVRLVVSACMILIGIGGLFSGPRAETLHCTREGQQARCLHQRTYYGRSADEQQLTLRGAEGALFHEFKGGKNNRKQKGVTKLQGQGGETVKAFVDSRVEARARYDRIAAFLAGEGGDELVIEQPTPKWVFMGMLGLAGLGVFVAVDALRSHARKPDEAREPNDTPEPDDAHEPDA